VYGFTGLRIRAQGLVEAYPPLLPAEWKRLTLRTSRSAAQRYDIVVSRDDAGRVRLHAPSL